MPVANVKETTMITEPLPASSRLSGNIEETPHYEAAGKPPILLAQKKAEKLP